MNPFPTFIKRLIYFYKDVYKMLSSTFFQFPCDSTLIWRSTNLFHFWLKKNLFTLDVFPITSFQCFQILSLIIKLFYQAHTCNLKWSRCTLSKVKSIIGVCLTSHVHLFFVSIRGKLEYTLLIFFMITLTGTEGSQNRKLERSRKKHIFCL